MKILYVLVQVIMYYTLTYTILGFEWNTAKFFWYFYVTYFGIIMIIYYSIMMMALTPNATIATIYASFYSLFNLFVMFLITN